MSELFALKWRDINFQSNEISITRSIVFQPAGLAGTIQAQIVDEERQKPQQIEESYRFPADIT